MENLQELARAVAESMEAGESFTDFLDADGEKPWRNRDSEFDDRSNVTRAELLDKWNDGWAALFSALEPLSDEDLSRIVTIRGVKSRVHEALLLNDRYELHAGIDCSDGLSLDLSRLAAESHVGAVLDLNAIPIAEAAKQLANSNPAGGSALLSPNISLRISRLWGFRLYKLGCLDRRPKSAIA